MEPGLLRLFQQVHAYEGVARNNERTEAIQTVLQRTTVEEKDQYTADEFQQGV